MKRSIRILAVFALAGALALAWASAADAQPYTLRYHYRPGEQRTYQRTQRTESLIRQGENSRRTVTEQTGTHDELVVREGDQPGTFLLAILLTPGPEQIVTLEINGEDQLANVPEEARRGEVPPTITLEERGPRGEPPQPPERLDDPGMGLAVLQGAMSHLPEQPVSAGDSWSRELDLGAIRGTLRSTFVEVKKVGGTPCAVLDVALEAVIPGDVAARIRIEKMEARLSVALDGTGLRDVSATHIIRQTGENFEQRTEQTFNVRLKETRTLDADALAVARADADALLIAIKQIRADDLVAAVESLQTFLNDRADGPWASAVQILFSNVLQQRLITKPWPEGELRVILRDLRRAHDEAQQRGVAADIISVRDIARRVANTNLQVILADSQHEDPFVRELAVFGLTFAEDPAARRRLVESAKDPSGPVRAAAGVGLAIQQTPIGRDLLLAMLKDTEPTVRGAAALLALRTVRRDDPTAAVALPLLLANLAADHPWVRAQTVGAVGALAPIGSTEAVAVLLDAAGKETTADLKPLYLQVLHDLTGLESDKLEDYAAWLAKQQEAPKAPPPAETVPTPKG